MSIKADTSEAKADTKAVTKATTNDLRASEPYIHSQEFKLQFVDDLQTFDDFEIVTEVYEGTDGLNIIEQLVNDYKRTQSDKPLLCPDVIADLDKFAKQTRQLQQTCTIKPLDVALD